MLRPATPLTVLLFVAFVLLLISVISTPVVKSIPLASFEGVDFGVFGYCGKTCSGIKVGYATNIKDASGTASDGDGNFSLPSNARSSLSSILIVHPIAALFTLICLILAASAHLHAPSHSPRYLLALLILLLPTLLITLLAFLVDILLFVPHLAWGGWIVLGSTILITASGVVTCAMRRTLVSRKARKKRIAENVEMNGENLYNRQSAIRAESPPPLDTQATKPTANGGPGPDQLPAFATYESKNPRITDEERIPLNTRTPSNRTLPSNGITHETSDDGFDRFAGPGRGGQGGMRGGRGGPFNGPRDEYGNPLPSSNAFGPLPAGALGRDSSDTRIGHRYSNETMKSQGSRGRGRGGYPARGYARGGPHGPGRGPGMNGNGRGMSMGPMAAGAGAGMMAEEMDRYRPEGPPPGYAPGYAPGPGNGFPPGRGMPSYSREMSGTGGAVMYGRDPSASGNGRRPSPGPPSAPGYGRQPSPGPPSAPGYGRQPSPGPPSAPGYGRQPSPGPPSAPGHVRRPSPGYGRQPSPGPLSAPGYGRQPSPGPPSAPGFGRQSPGPPSAPGYGRQSPGPPSASGYGRQSPGPPSAPGAYGYGRGPSPGPPEAPQYRADSPPPPMPDLQHHEGQIIGQAVEMDAYTGSPSRTPVSNRITHLRDGDHDTHGGVGLQQQQRRDSPMSATSDYSSQEPYVPPRAAWAGVGSRSGTPPQNSSHPLSPVHAAPVEAPAQSPPSSPEPQPPAPSHIRINSADNYYEDVDPRFTEPQLPPALPSSLMPGGGNQQNNLAPQSISRDGSPSHIQPSTSYDSIPEGARSHASDASNYTSISQRGINPNWRPPSGPQGPGMGGAPDRRPVQRDILQTNPDFELPTAPRGGRMLGGRGGRGGRAPGMIPGLGPGGGGRYPGGEV
ncbi:regulator of ime2 [Pseudocyphellaria aurata]|nr:regulator of ime2 [Pseudocyphellaria aurata]